ncbi:MAG: lipopolysaccharide assembly protein LapA domain-containing protein [Elioraea sp.]|nr:lipopolysaccharide assembly protein LapA domain-containing protein [Elioraea sp.]MDW8442938.1 lipopolysaccharide assembly protein LapA domain-containing protein [Acetobacteraceae bacterium]
MRLVWLVTLVFAVLVVLFVVANVAPVSVGLWPFDTRIEVPLAVAALAVAAVFYLLGAVVAWASAVSARRRARRLASSVEALQAEIAVLKDKLRQAEQAKASSSSTALAPAR